MSRLKAIGQGKLLGHDCYVFDGGLRAMSKRGLVAMLSGGSETGNLEAYIKALPSRYANLAAGANIEFTPPGGGVGHAVDTKTITAICRAYSDADMAGELRANQRHLARNARRLLDTSAEYGLIYLIDEATGYDAIREAGSLGRLFAAEMRPWEETFPPSLVARLCALGFAGESNARWRGGSYPRPLASVFRRIYEFILGEAAAKLLKERNPDPRGGSNHHQWLTDEAHALLKKNVGIVEFCAQQSHTRGEFLSRLKAHYSGQSSIVFA